MKRSFLAIALLACAALASVCFHAVADPVIAACRRFKDIVLYGFKLAEIEPVNSPPGQPISVYAPQVLSRWHHEASAPGGNGFLANVPIDLIKR